MQVERVYNAIKEAMSNCKDRPSQLNMIKIIDNCFSHIDEDEDDGQNLCLIEAPTGTGKSLAYLIPGVINAKKLNKKLIISTATKTLQNQLFEKDIPDFIKNSGINFSYGLAKGRGNYLCPYQLEINKANLSSDLLEVSSKNSELLIEITDLYKNKTWDGDLDRAPIHFDNKVKNLITTDKDRCIGYSCAYNQKNDCTCPFYLNREELKNCEVIVTNHSMLLADLALGGGNVLPVKPNDYLLCIDEGHNFADVAINSFTQFFQLKQTINNCQNLAKLIYSPQTSSYFYTDISVCDELLNKTEDLISSLDEFLVILTQNIGIFVENRLILNDYLNPNLNVMFRDCFVNFAFISGEIYMGLGSIQERLKETLKAGPDFTVENNLNKLGFYLSTIEAIMVTSQYILNCDDSRYNANFKYIEVKQVANNEDFIICSGLTHVGKTLFNTLWNQVYASVITSATLAIGKDFTYYKDKLGLNLFKEVKSYKLETSFVYQNQAQLVVPRFNYAPDFSTRNEFTRELIKYLTKTLDYDEGYGTLVLFFNKAQLQEVHNALPKYLCSKILLQTDFLGNHRLINEHKKKIADGKPSIIFGLNSFAEGVDLPSIYCMHVIVTKLPFETHKDPLNMVQEYWVRFEKSNYFADVSLPEAGIRLIQAVGRLIRNEDDFGQVSICDNRLITKSYGSILLDALPNFNRKYNSSFITEAFAKIKVELN